MSQPDVHRSPIPHDESPSAAVLDALAREEDVSPDRLETVLYDAVDPDALDKLFAPRHDGTARSGGAVTLAVGDREVTVSAEGAVTVSADR